MISSLLFLLHLQYLFSCKMKPKKILLNGMWTCYPEGAKKETSVKVPSNWEKAGIGNYKGKLYYETCFCIEKLLKKKEYWLRFKGVDYSCKVWLNKNLVGKHIGYFQPFEFLITKPLKTGENQLLVEVDSGPEKDSNWPEHKKHVKGVFGHHDIRPGSWHPKYGQDCSTGGIWNDVMLLYTDRLRILDVKCQTQLTKNLTSAKVTFYVSIVNTSPEAAICVLKTTLGLQKKIHVPSGTHIYPIQLNIKNPELWWCWDQGKPYLYRTIISLIHKGRAIDTHRVEFGIREVKLTENMEFYLNKRKVFLRGTNIIPEEYLSTYTTQRIQQDLVLAKEANINTLRVHAHVTRKEFYKYCDKTGILIWQDFPLQWEYSNDEEFIWIAKAQLKDMINYLYNHPSIILWCTHNEPIKSKQRLDPILYKTAKKLDGTRAILQSSDFEEHPYPGW